MRFYQTCVIVAVFMLFNTFSIAQGEKYSTVKIYLPADRTQKADLIGLLQIDHFYETEGGAIISEISAEDLTRLRTTRYRYEILIDDVARDLEIKNRKYYEEKASGANSRMAFEQTGRTANSIISTPSSFTVQPTFGGYYSFAQMETAMDDLVSAYPSLAQKISLGFTHQGRDVWCIKISDNVTTDETGEPEVLYIGLQHAREAIGGSSMIFFMQYLCEMYATDSRIRDIVDNREVFIIPCMNPDGWEYNRLNGGAGSGWRKNRRNNGGGIYGVDLNRNWGVDWSNCSAPIVGSPSSCGSSDPSDDTYYGPSSFSEPETQAIRDFTYTKNFVAMIDQHAYGPYYSLPFGRPSLPANTMTSADDNFYTYIASAMGNYNGMRAGNSPQSVGYEVAGGVKDWMLKGNIGTGSKGKVMGMTGEGGAGGGTGGAYGSFWAPASQIINLCKGMTYQNLQLLYAAGSYVDLQDQDDIAVTSLSGTFSFHLRRVGLEDRPVTVSLIPMENIETTGSPVTVTTLNNYYDTYTGTISYSLRPAIGNGQRVRFAWRIETGGYSWYDTVTKFYNPITLFADDMEGSNVNTNWAVTSGWNYTTENAYTGSKSLTESPGGNYPASSTRRATYTGVLDLSDATAAWLSFWVKHRAENFYDKLQIEVSDDNGTTWTAVSGSTTVEEPGTLDGSTLNGQPALTGIKEEWTRELFDLGAWLNTPALRLRFEFTSGATSSYDFSEDDGFHIDNIKVIKSTSTLVTLPVQFISFTGRLLPDNTVRLDWRALTDAQHDYFEVERSTDGTSFISIGPGPASTPYWKIDPTPLPGNNYYRIKQADKDGKITYSNTINVYYNPDAFTVSVYPNPVTDIATIKINTLLPVRYTVSLSDMAGRKVHEESLMTGASGSEINIDFKGMASQVYILQVRNERKEIIASQKIVKQ
ncbi:MAG: T9SS type A sorting domain-containing protein [Chitinophagaceae bacterium]|nr:T9SS type A sorting domain-containing protein [Chitinophagaceae bacterium]